MAPLVSPVLFDAPGESEVNRQDKPLVFGGICALEHQVRRLLIIKDGVR